MPSDAQGRHKCFLSYYVDDSQEVAEFRESFDSVFVPKSIGVTDDDDFIESPDSDYVMRRIRESYLTDSTVTIVLIGKCTHARKYVDWEIASTLRNDTNNKRSGLIGINLKSIGTESKAPERLQDNLAELNGVQCGYARYYPYPSCGCTLEDWIQESFDRRDSHSPNNTRELFKNNRPCN